MGVSVQAVPWGLLSWRHCMVGCHRGDMGTEWWPATKKSSLLPQEKQVVLHNLMLLSTQGQLCVLVSHPSWGLTLPWTATWMRRSTPVSQIRANKQEDPSFPPAAPRLVWPRASDLQSSDQHASGNEKLNYKKTLSAFFLKLYHWTSPQIPSQRYFSFVLLLAACSPLWSWQTIDKRGTVFRRFKQMLGNTLFVQLDTSMLTQHYDSHAHWKGW